MKSVVMAKRSWITGAAVFVALMMLSLTAPAQTVVNGDFETDTELFATFPGYVGGDNPAEVSGWTGTGGRGINPIADGGAPFRDNGDNMTSVAFLQGGSSLQQDIAGLIVGNEYVLSFDFNARNCCGGGLPLATVELGGVQVANSADVFPAPGGVIPVGGTEPWYHVDIDFMADDTTLTLAFLSGPAVEGTDATFLVDNVSIVPEPTSGLLAVVGMLSLLFLRRRNR